MMSEIRKNLTLFSRFLRSRSLARTIVVLLSAAMLLLLTVNVATFVMIRRTAEFNDTVEHIQRVRLVGKDALTRLVDAETGQRGFLLTGRPEYLRIHDDAIRVLPGLFDELESLAATDDEMAARVARVRGLSDRRLAVMERSISLARTGRPDEAIQVVRSGEGKVLMDAMRAEIAAIDEIEATQLQFRTRQSERAGGLTVVINAVAGLLILMLAAITGWLVRRYIADMVRARLDLDRLNAGLEGQVRDRTAALSRANDEIQRFAYIVSHDLRAPLVNIMGYTSELEQAGRIIDRQMTKVETVAPELAESDALTAVREDIPEAVGFIRTSSEKMDRLINAILKMSREGRRSLTPEPLDMTRMVQAIADSVRHQTHAGGAEVTVEFLPELHSDRLSVEQIFGNLVDNAVKYLEPSRPGQITVSGVSTAETCEYRITDNGRGIAPRDHERIFELFRRAGRQDQKGEGLGLAFVRNSVRRLGGEISVESELGQGSTFLLTFPKHLTVIEAGDAV